MSLRNLIWVTLILTIGLPFEARGADQIEPDAGHWRPWVITSAAAYRAPAPPNPAETQAELRQMFELIHQNDATDLAQVTYWDAGAPAYRWMDLINARANANLSLSPYPVRLYTYVALAMYDATVATWESKYYYQRRRPSEFNRLIPTAVDVPNSPSYPSEHASTAWAAAAVLSYFFPAEASTFQALADQAGWSRVLAGVQYPSDVEAGKALGLAVADAVIAKSKTDGSAIAWAGTVPTGPCRWYSLTMTPPGNASAATWNPLLLTSPGQFRPPAPPACTSPQMVAETAIVKNFPRTFITNYKGFYWQSPEGLNTWPYRYADTWIAEDHLDRNPPRVARIYALLAATFFDAFIASQDGKFTYWYIRPSELDTSIIPLFAVPNFPSYPSNHSTFSAARSEMLAYLFPTRATFIRAVGVEAGDSRIWAGIHFPIDNVAGHNLGVAVAQVFIGLAETDGSQ